MLLSLEDLVTRYELKITGVLHCGAHLAEEAEAYYQLDVPIWWVEANPGVMIKLEAIVKQWPRQEVIQALVADTVGTPTPFHVTNYDGMSSSVFEFGTHTFDSPDTVYVDQVTLTSTTIDQLVADHGIVANFLNLDLQGCELLALRGAIGFLEGVDYLYSEVSTGPVYVGGAQRDEIDEFLVDFERVETDMGMHRGTHGDAFYRRIK